MDSVANAPHDQKIMPGNTHRQLYGPVEPMGNLGGTRVEFKAAIFQDGSVFGDPAWAQRIVDNRKTLYEGTHKSIQELQAARQLGETREQIIERFKALEEAAEKAAQTSDERMIGGQPYGQVLVNLEHATIAGGAPPPVDVLLSVVISQLRATEMRLLTSKPPIGVSHGP